MSVVTIDSLQRFQNVVGGKEPVALVAFETPLGDEINNVLASAAEAHTNLKVAKWNCSKFPEAKATLSVTADPTIYAITGGKFLDKLEGASDCATNGSGFIRRFAEHIEAQKTKPAEPSAAKIDIAKMIAMGRDLMLKDQAMYAEKFFAKAAGVVDAILPETSSEELLDTLALALGWQALACAVQGKVTEAVELKNRLEGELLAPHVQHETDASRAVAVVKMMQGAPRAWNRTDCSCKKLREALKASPRDNELRSMLVVTLFLEGSVEESATEAIKLHVLGNEFGATAMDAMVGFFGKEHVLIQRMGWLQLRAQETQKAE